MYLSFYHLKHKPFQISTDPRFLWLGEKHEEALATLRYGVLDNKGFLLLTGDVGTGKTTLLNALIRTLDKNTYVAFLRDPALQQLDFFQYVAHAFGMKIDNINTKVAFLIQFEKFLQDAYTKKRKVLLIIDEAQRMNQELLEEVRLLSNIEREESKLLNIFFVGQIEFNDIIHHPENRAIRQRITVNYNIESLSEEETRKYIKHRLEIASSKEDIGFFTPVHKKESGEYVRQGLRLPLPEVREEIFTQDAIKEIHSFSMGYPRLINIICDRALLTGFVEEAKSITLKHIKECVRELEIPHDKEKIVVREKSVTSLKNSLEQLNREFEEKRRLEALQNQQKDDSPRELIKRLEEVNTVSDNYQEAQQDDLNIQEIAIRKSEQDNFSSKASSEERNESKEEAETEDLVNTKKSGNPLDDNPITTSKRDTEESKTRELLDELSRAANSEDLSRDVPISSDIRGDESAVDLKDAPQGDKDSRKILILGIVFALIIFTYHMLSSKDSSNSPKPLEQGQPADNKILPLKKSGTKKSDQTQNNSTPADSDTPLKTLQSSNLKRKPENTPKINLNNSTGDDEFSQAMESELATTQNTPHLVPGKSGTAMTERKTLVSHNGNPNESGAVNNSETNGNNEPIIETIQQLKSLITFERLVIPFPQDSSLPQTDSLETLNNLVESLMAHPSFNVTLSYLVKVKGTPAEMDKLSEFRANAIKSYLVGRGLLDSRITITRLDESKLSASGEKMFKENLEERWVAIDVSR